MALETELAAQGYLKIGRNLFSKDDSYYYLREGKLLDARTVTAADAKAFDVEVPKIPKPAAAVKSEPGPLEKYAAKVANLNELTGEAYDRARAQIEKTDDALIEAELRGEVLMGFVFRFQQAGKEVVGLTYSGIKEIAKRVGRISIESMDIQDKPDSYIVICKGVNKDNEVQMIGLSEQSKWLASKDGKKTPDPFALQKAASKASRNTLKLLIPETQSIVLLKHWLAEAGARNGKS